MEIDANEIKITAKPFKLTVDNLNNIYTIQDSIIDKNKQLYDWCQALDNEKMMPGQENFNRMFLGIWKKEKPSNKERRKKMLESMNLIDLYANKHKENIEKETKEKVEELRKKCDVINKYNELVEKFEKDCDELYLSQFTEEEKNEILINQDMIDDADMQLRTTGGPSELKYYINKNFHNEEYFEIMNDRNKKVDEINDLVKMVKAHIGIAKTKEEVEEILTRYGIIDKKGKLVIK